MKKKEQIDYIKINHKSQRTFDDYTNYFIFIFPLAFIGIGLSMLFNFFKFHTGLPILLVGLCFVALGTVLGFFTNKRLTENLTFVQINLPPNGASISRLFNRKSGARMRRGKERWLLVPEQRSAYI